MRKFLLLTALVLLITAPVAHGVNTGPHPPISNDIIAVQENLGNDLAQTQVELGNDIRSATLNLQNQINLLNQRIIELEQSCNAKETL